MEIPKRMHELLYTPAVFAVKNKYQIMAMARSDLLFWVEVNGQKYYDHSNGIIRSSTRVHRVNVPVSELDDAGEYTVHYRRIIERKAYFPTLEDEVSQTFKFRGLPKEGPIRMYHLSDAHSRFTLPSKAASYFGDDIDLFILNGDIPNHSGDVANFNIIYQFCEAVTGGARPCIFSRGNHDTRGFFAENIAEYTPTENGYSYYTFRLGRLWGIVMDCGEDKVDEHPEYGGTVACHQFRREETEYLERIIKNADEEYAAPGVDYRLVIVHNPFSHTIRPPFDIEQPLFSHWLKLLGENVKPQAMLSGHLHMLAVSEIGGKLDDKGQICPVIVGSRETRDEKRAMVDFTGAAITIDGYKMKVQFTNSNHESTFEQTLDLIK